jgi:hypothetical protein
MYRDVCWGYNEKNTNGLANTVAINAGRKLLHVLSAIIAVHRTSSGLNVFNASLDRAHSLIVGPAVILNENLAEIVKILSQRVSKVKDILRPVTKWHIAEFLKSRMCPCNRLLHLFSGCDGCMGNNLVIGRISIFIVLVYAGFNPFTINVMF